MGHTLALAVTLVLAAGSQVLGSSIDPAMQTKVDERKKVIRQIAANPIIIKAVNAHNASRSDKEKAMTQDHWKSLSITNELIVGFMKNEAANHLRAAANADPAFAEMFVSGAEGFKVAFLGKTTNWCHKGAPKHDEPMANKDWQGVPENDASTGFKQMQVSVPITDGGKPIGSLVVGLIMSKI